ncbi:hypothetical protein [Motilibacter aurantiacus]|uniref:hypothetical protein n=1 Tax=Motilibacter aurantiacus TaxID=2714955 RepID=UPI00140A97FD|nr:hypothetical protein [Motilibacter aurantiacus]NHC45514.1 hypothetical protein [Motilibacter aurantiacus]
MAAKGERARRRALLEAERARAAQERELRDARSRRRRVLADRWRARLPRRTRIGRPTGRLARRRRMQSLGLLAALVLAQGAVWLSTDDWLVRAGALLLAIVAAPVLAALLFDRRH